MLPGFPQALAAQTFGPQRFIQMANVGAGSFRYDHVSDPPRGTLSGSPFRTPGDYQFLQIACTASGPTTGYFDLYAIGTTSPFAAEALSYRALYVAGVRYPIVWEWQDTTLRGTNANRFGLATTSQLLIQLGP